MRPRRNSALGPRAELATRSWRPPPAPSGPPTDRALLAVGGPRARRLSAIAGAPAREAVRRPRSGQARGGARRCWSAAAQMPGRARAGPGLPRLRANARRAIVVKARAAFRKKLELGRGPGHRPCKLAGAAGRVRCSLQGDARDKVPLCPARQLGKQVNEATSSQQAPTLRRRHNPA